jgi:hypothetical protein
LCANFGKSSQTLTTLILSACSVLFLVNVPCF